MKTIEEHIAEMLKENTGTHFLDSGGDDGRQWQRNQVKDFESEERVTFDVYSNEITDTVSTYHYLTEVLSIDNVSNVLNKLLEHFRDGAMIDGKQPDCHWVQDCAELLPYIYQSQLNLMIPGEIKIDSESSVNTYNGENNLSQVLQFITFLVEDTPYVLLQIHGGADVRGGYTATRCFKLDGYLTGQVDVYGSIDGIEVSNTYNGWSLTNDETNEDIKVKEDSKVSLDFYIMEDTYMYE